MGVRQGENLSPVLFAIYLNDFNVHMKSSLQGLKTLDNDAQKELETFMRLYVLLYADDTIILAETADELQDALNGLAEYCKKWHLKVNIAKTKIVIFSRGKVRKYPKFLMDSNEIEVVEQYVYLGVLFNYNGSFKKAIHKQITQARKAMFAVVEKSKVLRLPVDIVCELFNVCWFQCCCMAQRFGVMRISEKWRYFTEASCEWYWKHSISRLMLCYMEN